MAMQKPYTSGRFMLELENNGQNVPVGFITSIDGGHFKSEPVKYLDGTSLRPTLFPGKPKYDDITIQMGIAVAPAFWDWVKATLNGKHERRSGAIVGYDFNNKEVSRRTFTNAIMAELQLPALDAAAKNAALITVKMSPETLTFKKGDGSSLKLDYAQGEIGKQKQWVTSNFRLTIDKFKGNSMRFTKIEGITIKQNVINNAIGTQLESLKEFGRLEVPNLVVTFPEAYAPDWWDWYQDTVVNGNHGNATTAEIAYLSYNLADTLMTLNMDGVQLLSIETEKYEASKEQISKVKATLTVEAMDLKKGAGNAA